VAPITIHHRVDFAASMVDGRTVGEVIPDSPSAKEVHELWIYVQDRLARLVKDPTLAPENRPEYFAISSLSPGLEEAEEIESPLVAEDVPALNARLNEAFTPTPEIEIIPIEKPRGLVPYEPPAPVAESPAPAPEPAKPKLVRNRPTLFGGSDRQTNTFGRRS
jgi:chromosome partitioning protein